MDVLAKRLTKALGSAYELGPVVGRGGMGAVYRATDRRLRREVAVKVLPPELGYAPDLRTRFVHEAQMAAQLSHPNIVPIYDVGEQGDLVWFIMALVDGETLRAKVEREGPQPMGVVRRVLEQVGQALAYAHAKGVVHRDIKPDNILIETTERALVMDFGIAKALDPSATDVTRPGEIVGTARYMAPEQALDDGVVDARADIYALGLVGYFMLTGEHAMKATTLPAVILEHARGAAVDFAAIERRVPRVLAASLQRAVAREAASRFQSLEQFLEELRQLGGELPDVPPPVRKLLRESERSFVIGTIVAFAVGLVGVEHLPLGFLVLMASGIVGQWAVALEKATAEGVGWADIRRALYLERAKRLEEVRTDRPGLGPAGALTLVGGLLLGMYLVGSIGWGEGSWINIMLYGGGILGGAFATRLFGMPRVRAKAGGRPARMVIGGLLAVLALALAVIVAPSLAALSIGEIAGLLFGGGVLAILIYGSGKLVRRLTRGVARAVTARRPPPATPEEWRVPGWLDTVGSWLFARITRDGWRLRVERDRPVRSGPSVDVAEARRRLEEIDRWVRRLRAGDTRGHAEEARRLALDLVAECRSAARRLVPLAATIARLNDGVMVSRTMVAGGSLETELDRAEAEADRLRVRGAEYLEMLCALEAAVELAARAQDTTQLERALERARHLSDAADRTLEAASSSPSSSSSFPSPSN